MGGRFLSIETATWRQGRWELGGEVGLGGSPLPIHPSFPPLLSPSAHKLRVMNVNYKVKVEVR